MYYVYLRPEVFLSTNDKLSRDGVITSRRGREVEDMEELLPEDCIKAPQVTDP